MNNKIVYITIILCVQSRFQGEKIVMITIIYIRPTPHLLTWLLFTCLASCVL